MGADYEASGKDDVQISEFDDDDMMVVKGEDEERYDTLERMYGSSFVLPFAQQECKSSSVAVKDFSVVFTPDGKSNLTRSVKHIAKGVLTCTDPNINLASKEAQSCIEETASRAQESTAAGRLADIFPLANITGEVEIQVDPSQLHINEGDEYD